MMVGGLSNELVELRVFPNQFKLGDGKMACQGNTPLAQLTTFPLPMMQLGQPGSLSLTVVAQHGIRSDSLLMSIQPKVQYTNLVKNTVILPRAKLTAENANLTLLVARG